MEVGTRGNFHAWKLSTFGDGWGVHAPTKQRRIGHPTEKKRGKKGRGRGNEKKKTKREIVEHRVKGSILHGVVREKLVVAWNRTCRLSIDRPRSQSFERIVSPISHPFNLSRLRTNAMRPISSIENPFPPSSRKRIRKLRAWNDFEFESHLDRSRRRERSDILEA